MEILEQSNWYTGHVEQPWWSIEDFYYLNYENQPFNDQTTLAYWQSLGFSQEKYTGDLYGMPNEIPDWVSEFKETFNWNHFSWQVYKMNPGTTLPVHSDTYKRFREVHNISDPKQIRRAVVFLENWQSGHYFEIDSNNLGYWKKGDYVVWENDVKHIAANVGSIPRYTLQITGTVE